VLSVNSAMTASPRRLAVRRFTDAGPPGRARPAHRHWRCGIRDHRTGSRRHGVPPSRPIMPQRTLLTSAVPVEYQEPHTATTGPTAFTCPGRRRPRPRPS
jgi:hypothetical protein